MTDHEPTDRIEETGPPARTILYAVVNPLVELLLRSPLHDLLSDSLLLLTFIGRRSGREYTTPVGYHRLGDGLVVFTHSGWWRNLRGGRPVTLRLRGERRRAEATPVTDPEAVAEHVHRFLETHGTDAARRIGLQVEGESVPDQAAFVQALEETVVLELELEDR